jgi:serine/threonine-protein kinase
VWSRNGSAAFLPGGGVTSDRTLVWVSRDGRLEPTTAPARPINFGQSGLRMSPDGTRAALTINTDARTTGASNTPLSANVEDIWIWEMRRNTVTRLSQSGRGASPVWTPDSRRVCYRSALDVLCQSADGSGPVQTLATLPEEAQLRSFSPDATRLVWNDNSQTNSDIFVTTIGPTVESRPLIPTRFNEGGAVISPDGRWLAYYSNETGRNEVYVRPFPDVEAGRSQVSTEGGFEPRWAKNGRELFFISGGGPVPRLLWSATIEAGSSFNAGKPTILAKLTNGTSAAYDVAQDGRFLFHMPAATNAALLSQIVVVEHWFDELRERVPLTPSP